MIGKKIGIVCCSPGFGGLEMNTLRLMQWMQERGWEMLLLAKEETAIYQKAVEAGLTVEALKGNRAIISRAKFIGKWVKKNKLEILIVPFRRDLKSVSFYKQFFNRKIKVIYQQHMQVGVSKRDPIHTLRFSAVNAWISPLDYLKEETLAKTYVPAGKIHVIPFGLETNSFEQTKWTAGSARAALQLPREARIIGVLGRIDPKKGQDLVVRAIHELQEKYQRDYHLVLLGDATLNEGDAFSMMLKQLVIDLKLEHKIHFRSYKPDIMEFFRAIDVFAMPAHGETYGMVTLEAMAAGVPVIGTDRDGTKELLKDGKYGYLFPKDDVTGFCEQVIAMEKNKSLPQLLQQAKNEVIEHYSKDLMCAEMERVIEGL